MREGTRAPRTTAPAALVAAGLLLTACGTTPRPGAPAPGGTSTTREAAGGAEASTTLGGPGSACALPVSFALAEGWLPKAVKDPEDPELAELTHQGPAVVRCEVDAKPAGHIGYLRVWTSGTEPARAALEGFVRAEAKSTDVSYRETGAGAVPVVEVTYTVHNDLMDWPKEERAFAVAVPAGTVIVHLGGFDTEEHREMLPAYELARTTVKPR
ncbi:lipoprotein [Streptomyces sp. NPDC058872]|uniref:lipoprotein n=1 Tax=Streptomyces sp. NPDC058872 TaxID=3346661 RepID=UPI0036BCEB64